MLFVLNIKLPIDNITFYHQANIKYINPSIFFARIYLYVCVQFKKSLRGYTCNIICH